MSDRYDKYRFHTLVLWTPSGENDRYREREFNDAVEIKGRWFEVRHETVDTGGRTVTAEHSAFVDRDIPDGSWLMKASLSDIDKTKSPKDYAGPSSSNAHPVVNMGGVWDRRNVKFRTVSMT